MLLTMRGVGIGGFALTLFLPLAVFGQAAKPPSTDVDGLWNSLLQAPSTPSSVDPALTPPQVPGKETSGNFRDHFFFESHSDYYRYDTSFNGGVPTLTGIINTPNTGLADPNGFPYPPIFQTGSQRFENLIDMGTRGWLSDRIETHFTLRHDQDLSTVNPGSAAENMVETFPGNREYQILTGSIEIHGNPGSGLDVQLGRMNIYGAEIASLDGASVSLNKSFFDLTIYGGRRFTYYGNPAQRGIGGVNFALKFSPNTTLEYDGLWYVKGTHGLSLRQRFGNSWMWTNYFRMVGGSPVDFNSQVMFAPGSGKTSLRVAFFQKLSNKDYFYDYTELARDRDVYNSLTGLNLGPISEYSQFMVDAHRALASRLQLGGSVWVRRLTNEQNQGPFDTSFEDYRGHGQIFPLRKTELFLEYHQRNSDRLSPLNSTTLDNISFSGETSVKDVTGEVRQSFGEGRFGLSGGVYYRRISMQDQFFFLDNLHQSGWLAGAWWKVDSHAKFFVDYNLDNDFFLFMPDLKNSRALHAGITWKY